MDITNILEELRAQRDQIDRAISALDGAFTKRKLGRPVGSANKPKRRTMSPEARAKIAKSAKARWRKAKAAGKASLAA